MIDGVVAGFGQRQFALRQILFRQTLFSQEPAHGQDSGPHLREVAGERKPQRDSARGFAGRFGHAFLFLDDLEDPMQTGELKNLLDGRRWIQQSHRSVSRASRLVQ